MQPRQIGSSHGSGLTIFLFVSTITPHELEYLQIKFCTSVFLKNDIVLFKKFVKRVITIFEILFVNSASTTVVISFTATMKMWTHNSLSGSTFASWFYFPANRAVAMRTIGIVCAKRIGIHYSSGRSGQVQNFENLPHFWHTLQVQNVSRHTLDISPSMFENLMSSVSDISHEVNYFFEKIYKKLSLYATVFLSTFWQLSS